MLCYATHIIRENKDEAESSYTTSWVLYRLCVMIILMHSFHVAMTHNFLCISYNRSSQDQWARQNFDELQQDMADLIKYEDLILRKTCNVFFKYRSHRALTAQMITALSGFAIMMLIMWITIVYRF